jgi:hypothetical protein
MDIDQINKPPLGLLPQWLWVAQRCNDINMAIDRYEKAGKEIPKEWIEELIMHCK